MAEGYLHLYRPNPVGSIGSERGDETIDVYRIRGNIAEPQQFIGSNTVEQFEWIGSSDSFNTTPDSYHLKIYLEKVSRAMVLVCSSSVDSGAAVPDADPVAASIVYYEGPVAKVALEVEGEFFDLAPYPNDFCGNTVLATSTGENSGGSGVLIQSENNYRAAQEGASVGYAYNGAVWRVGESTTGGPGVSVWTMWSTVFIFGWPDPGYTFSTAPEELPHHINVRDTKDNPGLARKLQDNFDSLQRQLNAIELTVDNEL